MDDECLVCGSALRYQDHSVMDDVELSMSLSYDVTQIADSSVDIFAVDDAISK